MTSNRVDGFVACGPRICGSVDLRLCGSRTRGSAGRGSADLRLCGSQLHADQFPVSCFRFAVPYSLSMFRALLLLPFLTATALGQARVVDPRLRAVVRHQLSPTRLSIRSDHLLPVYVELPGGATALLRRGWAATHGGTDIARLLVDEAGLAALVKEVDLSRVELGPRLRPNLDRSLPTMSIPQARLETGLDGTGVLVAQIDTGADVRHRDFRNADGTSRFAIYLDMSQKPDGRHRELGNFGGRAFSGHEIDQVLAAEAANQTPDLEITGPDYGGHGTHVLSIAAGNGFATGNGFAAGRYVGVAPGADLAAVQALDAEGYFDDQAILNGSRALVAFAAQRGQPLVVNMSLGGSGSPRDGSALFDRVLDEIFPIGAPGRALVVAAGNEGYLDQHAALWQIDGTIELLIEVGASNDPEGVLAIEYYYRGGQLEAELLDPAGKRYGIAPYKGGTDNGETAQPRVSVDNGNSDSDGNDEEATALTTGLALVLANGGAGISAGIWRLRLSGRIERLDSWIVIDADYGATHFVNHVSRDTLLGSPATAKSPIVVGAYATRADWTSLDGPQRDSDVAPGVTTYFSSSGPTTDGRFIPDVTAPGEYIIAAMSGDSDYLQLGSDFYSGDESIPGLFVAEDGVHGALRGTSMASPHVAGLVALMLELDPTLDSNALRAILRSTATVAPGERGFSPRGGFGQASALTALRYTGGQRGTQVNSTRSTLGVNRDLVPPSDERFVVTVTPRDDFGLPLGDGHTVQIAASVGLALDPVQAVGGGRYEQTFLSKGPRGAESVITARVDGIALASQAKVFFVADRAEAGRPFVPSGGCSVVATSIGDYYAGPMVVLRLFFCFAFLAALSACGKKIGDECKQNVDCDPLGTRFCDVSSPHGYCTVEGCENDSCPSESLCVRFYTQNRSAPCTFLPDLPNSRSDCRADERCVCDESVEGACVGDAHCAPEASERRWCMKKCSDDSKCRGTDYECRSTGTLGALPVPTLGNPDGTDGRFCAPASSFED